jgi:hypothetical protein
VDVNYRVCTTSTVRVSLWTLNEILPPYGVRFQYGIFVPL